MDSRVFIDSGAFIAFLDRSDRLHDEVVAMFKRRPRSWSTSVLVLSETYGWFLHRLGEDAARTFRLFAKELPALTIFGADRKHRDETEATLDGLRGCKLTYVDASSLTWIQKKNIRIVWGTDHHLAIEGAKVIPGPP